MKTAPAGRPRGLALLAAALVLLGAGDPASAQGGAPLVTDDPNTPGDGKWEINLVAQGSRNRAGRWDLRAPDLDINYGWGERLQLKLDLPWAFALEPGQSSRSGLGRIGLGLKWRFVDQERAGYAMAIAPQYVYTWRSSSRQRGITPPNDEFFLPVELATRLGDYAVGMELGRNVVQNEAGYWVLGAAASRSCGGQLECEMEVRKTFAPGSGQTLLNFGLRWQLGTSHALLAALGRETGPLNPEQAQTVFYLGLRWLP